jgi:predicted XRE-type DNA-binding protein
MRGFTGVNSPDTTGDSKIGRTGADSVDRIDAASVDRAGTGPMPSRTIRDRLNAFVALRSGTAMADLPRQFREDYENRGETFFAVARLLLANHGRQYTQSDIAAEVGVSQSRVSDFTQVLTADGWIDRRSGRTTFVWNTERHNPAKTVATDAVFGLYRDLAGVFRTHTRTSTGIYALFGFGFFLAAAILLVFYLALRTGVFGESAVPLSAYLVLGLGLGLAGTVMTAIVPLQAFLNRVVDRFAGFADRE